MAAFGVRATGLALLAAWAGESLLQRRWRTLALRTALALAGSRLARYTASVKSSLEYRQPDYAYQRAHLDQSTTWTYSAIPGTSIPSGPSLGVAHRPPHSSGWPAMSPAFRRPSASRSASTRAGGRARSSMPTTGWAGRSPHWLASVAVILLSLPVPPDWCCSVFRATCCPTLCGGLGRAHRGDPVVEPVHRSWWSPHRSSRWVS